MTQVHETYKLAPFAPTIEGLEQLHLQLSQILDQISEKFAVLEGREGRVAVIESDIDLDGNRIRNVGQSISAGDAVSRKDAVGIASQQVKAVLSLVGAGSSSVAASTSHSVAGADNVSQSDIESALDALGTDINSVVTTLNELIAKLQGVRLIR